MYGIFTYIYHKNRPNVGKYTIHGWYGVNIPLVPSSHGSYGILTLTLSRTVMSAVRTRAKALSGIQRIEKKQPGKMDPSKI